MVGGMVIENPPPHPTKDTASNPTGEPELMARTKFAPSDYVLIVAALLLLAGSLGFIPVVASFPAALAVVVLGARRAWFLKRKVEADR